MPSKYHQRKFRKCPHCNKERKRTILADGRNKGHQRTCGSPDCIFISRNSPEVNVLKGHPGPMHPKWIIDRSKVKFRPRYEMSSWTKAVFARDNFTCQECNQIGGKLQAHHLLPYSSFPEWRWDVSNGLTLCVSCHKKTDSYGRRAVIYSGKVESAA